MGKRGGGRKEGWRPLLENIRLLPPPPPLSPPLSSPAAVSTEAEEKEEETFENSCSLFCPTLYVRTCTVEVAVAR